MVLSEDCRERLRGAVAFKEVPRYLWLPDQIAGPVKEPGTWGRTVLEIELVWFLAVCVRRRPEDGSAWGRVVFCFERKAGKGEAVR